MRKSGARTLTPIICSKPSGVAVHTLSRHVAAATLTTPCTTPNCLSAASITARGAAGSAMSASTNEVGVPRPVSSAARAAPRSALRPAITRPAASSATTCRAIASPSPWVPPLMTMTFPSSLPVMFRSSVVGVQLTIAALAACTCGRSLTSGTPTSQKAPPPVHEYASVCSAITSCGRCGRARPRAVSSSCTDVDALDCCSPSPRRARRSRRTRAPDVGCRRSGC